MGYTGLATFTATLPLAKRSITLMLAALLLIATGCDSSGMEDDGDNNLPPQVEIARVEITLQEIQVISDCDGGTNPGDWQFQIAFVDEGNSSLADPIDLPQGAAFGVHTGQATELLTASDNNKINLGQTVSFQRPREEGSGFGLLFSGYEWDAVDTPDPDMTNRSVTRMHNYQDGRFDNIIGTNEMTLGGGRCEALLRYTVTVQ
ncbi:MAG TPA: hypothetical protein VKP65_04465 [Rhodothermales bacterium]|nr:hypothetical protein [Rhodothermales bacterium]